jgi:hypothetical protein
MATLAELYTRLILDLCRDDLGSGGELEQAKVDAVSAAITRWKSEQFWFNRASGSGNTANGVATIAIPSGVHVPEVVSYLGEALHRVPVSEIAYRTETGVPSEWAENEGSIQLWPIPDGVYSLTVSGTADTSAPALGASNIWTTEAYELILAEAKVILCRGPLRDPEGAIMAKDAREEALTSLRRETRRRSASPRRTDLPLTESFNINRG